MTAAAQRVVNVDVADALDALAVVEGPTYAVLWAGSVPVGHVELDAGVPRQVLVERLADAIAPAVGERLFPDVLRAHPPRHGTGRSQPAASRSLEPHRLARARPLLEAIRGTALPPPDLSVVVCTRGRPVELERCLRALASLSPQPREIVIVDNTAEGPGCEELVRAFPGASYVRERRPGLSVARNAGIRAATSALIAFTDDDTVADNGWAGRIVEPFSDAAVRAVTGLVLPLELESGAQVAFQREMGGFNHGYRGVSFDSAYFAEGFWWGSAAWHVGAGANMAFDRKVFDQVGLFDERLGAGASGCSEDSEMWYRILAAGGEIRYHPAAVVHHQHRRDASGLEAQIEQYMRGHLSALFVQFARHRRPGDLRRAIVTLPVYLARTNLRALTGRPSAVARPYLRGYIRGLAFARDALRESPPPALEDTRSRT